MKAGELTDITIEEQSSPVVIELPDGKQITTTGYYCGTDKRGGSVIVICAGKQKGKKK